MSSKVLVTGANGFLGHYLCRDLKQKGLDVIATGRGECRLPFLGEPGFLYESMDFTDPLAIQRVFEKHRPGAVIHAGAMSKPDECEKDQSLAYTVNTGSTRSILEHASLCGSFFVFVSTDFVFDGEKGMYVETDVPHPVNYYGITKMEAEDAVRGYEHDWSIVRTVLVYGKPQTGRSNLLTIVKQKLENKEAYRVVDDQVRTPTYVEDLSRGITEIIERREKGIYHLSGDEIATPYQMALRTARLLGLDDSLILRATAADFVQPARRPLRTGFNIQKAKSKLGYRPLSIEEGLRKTFDD